MKPKLGQFLFHQCLAAQTDHVFDVEFHAYLNERLGPTEGRRNK